METLDTLVRDLTKVGSIPKSEARRRIQELLKEQRQRMAKRIEEEQERFRPAYEELDKSYIAGLQAALNIVLGEDNN